MKTTKISDQVKVTADWDVELGADVANNGWDAISEKERAALTTIVRSGLERLLEEDPLKWIPISTHVDNPETPLQLTVTFQIFMPEIAREIARLMHEQTRRRDEIVTDLKSWIKGREEPVE